MLQRADEECQGSDQQQCKAAINYSDDEFTSFDEDIGRQQKDQMDAAEHSDTSDTETEYIKPDDMLRSPVSSFLCNAGEELFVAGDDDGEETDPMIATPRSAKPNTSRKYECYECHQTFTYSSSLARHTLVHSGIKPYTCIICNKSFAQPGHLDIHKRTHTGEKPYTCDTCNKGFIDSTHLARHKRIHGDQKLYACDVCPKSFRQLGTLNIHKRTHSGVRPFTCDVCQKGFVDSTHLTIHKRNHTGERPYVCEICNKAFMNTSHLNRHRLIHLNEKPPTCDICNKAFTKRTSLTVHKRIHTRTKTKPSTDVRPPEIPPVIPAPTDLTLRRRTRMTAKSNSREPSLSSSSVNLPGCAVEEQIPVSAATNAAQSSAVIPHVPQFLIGPHVLPQFTGMFPVPTRFPMFDVSSALLRLPGLSKLAQMRHVAK